MTEPSTLSVVRNRAAIAEELRRLLPRMEGLRSAKPLPLGLPVIDRCLPQGGLAHGGMHEIVPEAGHTPAAFGFIVAVLASCLPASTAGKGKLFLVMPRYGFRAGGRPHGHGLDALGLDPGRLILVETAHRKETLWAVEEALRSGAPAAIAGAVDQLELKLSQRLQLAASDAGLPLFLLRPAPTLESSAAATRWRVGTAEAARDRFGLIARPRWRVKLERCRNGRPGEWIVEYDHVAHCFSLAAALADRPLSHGAGGERLAQAR